MGDGIWTYDRPMWGLTRMEILAKVGYQRAGVETERVDAGLVAYSIMQWCAGKALVKIYQIRATGARALKKSCYCKDCALPVLIGELGKACIGRLKLS